MKGSFFQEWATPFEQSALLYELLGRDEEARDTARLALKKPWWTISSDLDRCVEIGWNSIDTCSCKRLKGSTLGHLCVCYHV